jgi:3-hydroxybutyryl-CoA dehydratase
LTDKNLAEYTFENIKENMQKEFCVTITETIMDNFAKISGDYNPLHMDDQYASVTEFKKRICHGMLLASFFSKLIGMHLPGKNALYFTQSLNFVSPCFIGDVVTVKGKILSKSVATKIITLDTSIFNENGRCLVKGEAKVLVRK